MSELSAEIEQGKFRHFHFKVKLRSCLFGSGQGREFLIDASVCQLGQWLKEMTAKYGESEALKKLVISHDEIHAVARRLIRLYDSGASAEARTGFSEIEPAADKILKDIENLKHYLAEGKR